MFAYRESYERDGFLPAVTIVESSEAADHLRLLEETEARVGKLHYFNKVHLFFDSPLRLAMHPQVLDVVEQLIGEDILLYNVTYIIKEAHSESFVSWHQDLTYWGLSDDAQVSMWLALTPATAENGCMRMIPSSHKQGRLTHQETDSKDNVLDLGQTVLDVDESQARLCALSAGEASFHHGWTLHASGANCSDTRRVGLNVQYLAPHVCQTQTIVDSAMLVRGKDAYRHYQYDKIHSTHMTPASYEALKIYRDRFLDIYHHAH